MFGGRFSSAIGYVGVAMSHEDIKLVQVREHAGTLSVVGAAQIELPGQASNANASPSAQNDNDAPEPAPSPELSVTALAEHIRTAIASGGFTGRRCVIALPRDDVHLQSMRLPPMPDEEVRDAASWEVAQRLGTDRDAIQVDFIRTGARTTPAGAAAAASGGETREEFLAVAAAHATVSSRLEPILQAGVRPVAIDLPFTAIARTLSRHLRRESDLNVVRAVLDIEPSGSMLMILRGDQIAFAKQLAVGGRHFDQAVADHLQLDLDAAHHLRVAHARNDERNDRQTDRAIFDAVRPLFNDLIKEVTLCLRYFGVTFRGHPPDRVVLTGSASHEPRFSETLSRACSIEVVYDDAQGTLADVETELRRTLRRPDESVSAWVAAIGLSVRGIGTRRSMLSAVKASGSTATPADASKEVAA